jgi:hypothetical protein
MRKGIAKKRERRKRREENAWIERYVIFTSNHGMLCHVTL